MAEKTYICQGGYLTNPETNKVEFIKPGTEYVVDESIGDKSRLLKPAASAKKLVNNAKPKK